MDERPELMMPVSDEHALRQFEIEALRRINTALDKVVDKLETQGTTLHEMDNRLIRMEGNDALLRSLVAKVEALERDKDRRDGAFSLIQWLKDFTPWLLAILLAIAAALGWERSS